MQGQNRPIPTIHTHTYTNGQFRVAPRSKLGRNFEEFEENPLMHRENSARKAPLVDPGIKPESFFTAVSLQRISVIKIYRFPGQRKIEQM